MILPKSIKKTLKKQQGFSSLLLIVIVIILVLVVAGWFFLTQKKSENKTAVTNETSSITELSSEIKAGLDKKLELVDTLVQEPRLILALETASNKNSQLSKQAITTLDDQWKSTEGVSPFIQPFLQNETAQILTEFQENHPEFAEIFATDKVGVNVGQTNKTSDYYQADEDWWVDAYNAGVGKSYYGEIEYDESAKSESISLYVPVYNAQKEVVGIIKAVVSISALQREL